MKKRVAFVSYAAMLALTACGPRTTTLAEIALHEVTLPGGAAIRCEVMLRPEDMARGMMFRDALAPDRGMLFLHSSSGRYPYWMFQCKIALDIIWMDEYKRIVEISANTPPCLGPQSGCPSYGGRFMAKSVLELASGGAAAHNLKVGDRIDF